MVQVTEYRNVDGIGDVHKDVDYMNADAYSLNADGSLVVYKKSKDVNTEPAFEIYYPRGSFVKVYKSK